MRITDPGEEGQVEESMSTRSSSILNSLQRNSTVVSMDPSEGVSVPRSQVQVESSKLRQLLSNIPTDI